MTGRARAEFWSGFSNRIRDLQVFATEEIGRLEAEIGALQSENDRLTALVELARGGEDCSKQSRSGELLSLDQVDINGGIGGKCAGSSSKDYREGVPTRCPPGLQAKTSDCRGCDQAVCGPGSDPPTGVEVQVPFPSESPRDVDQSITQSRRTGRPHTSEFETAEKNKAKQMLKTMTAKRSFSDSSVAYKQTGCAQAIAKSPVFETVTLGVILLNAVWISVDLDHNTENSPVKPLFTVMDNLFCSYFTLELLVRFLAFGSPRMMFRDYWFMFDSVLVAFMVFETWVLGLVVLLSGAGEADGLGQISILRMFRLLRLTRMAKMMRAVPEVMIIVKGLVASLRSVLITSVLLGALTYIYAIVLKQLTLDTALGGEFYSTVPRGMLTLVVEGILPDNAGMMMDLLDQDWYLALLFFSFIFLASLTFMNMLVGFLCDVVSSVTAEEKENFEIEKMTEKFKGVFATLDTDYNGTVSKNELASLLQDKEAVQAVTNVGVDIMAMVDEIDHIVGHGIELPFEDFVDRVLQFRSAQTATVGQVSGLRAQMNKKFRSLEESLAPLVENISDDGANNSVDDTLPEKKFQCSV